jgi:hypothetical protein
LTLLLTIAFIGCSDDTKQPTPDLARDLAVADKGTADMPKADMPKADMPKADMPKADMPKADMPAVVADSTVCAADAICGVLTDFLAPTKAIDGVQVCVQGQTTPPCATSDAKGVYSIGGLTLTNDFALTYTKTGFVTFIGPYGKGQTDRSYHMNMLTTGTMSLLAGLLGTTAQAGKGHIILSSLSPTAYAAGTKINLGVTAGEGPYYVSTAGMPDKTLTETTSKGIGTLVNLPPGTYTLTYQNTKGLTCTRAQGWEGTTAGTLKVEVVADAMTVVAVICQ